MLDSVILPALNAWIESSANSELRLLRTERATTAFAIGEIAWDYDRVLERYELLYELDLVEEAHVDRVAMGEPSAPVQSLGRTMRLDHRRIFAAALGRLRGKIRYRPVVFEWMPKRFTLTVLQRVVEALVGERLHKQNFRRVLDRAGLVEGTGLFDRETGGRPAELFSFRREVLRERRAPGVGLPKLRR